MINTYIQVLTPTQSGSLDTHTYGTMILQAGEIIINGVSNTSPIDFSSLYSVQIDKEIEVTINKMGYYPITQKLNLFLDNEYLAFHLILDIRDLNNEYYNAPYSISKTVQDPCSFELTNYNMSSFPGERTVYLNGEEVGAGHVVVIPNVIEADVQIADKGITYDNNGQVWFASYVADSGFVTYLSNIDNSYYPYLSTSDDEYFSANTTTNFSLTPPLTFPLQYEIKDCYQKDEIVTLTIPAQGAYGGTITILKDGGATLLEDTFDTSVEYTVDLPLDELGLYNITVAITSPCPWLEKVTLEVCKSYKIEGKCSDYTFTNLGSKPLELITYLNNTDPATLESNIIVQPDDSISVTLALGVSSMQISTVDGLELTVEEVVPFYNFCELEDCMASVIENAMCEDLGCNCDYDVSTELKAMRNIMLNYALFSKIDVMEDFYKNLTESLSYDLFSIQQIIDKISKYCDRIKCTEKKGGCGCG